jgi:hypothetical protein
MHERIYTPTSSINIGTVITTNGALPLLHLHLEAWRRNHRGTPILIASFLKIKSAELEELCSNYGANVIHVEMKGPGTDSLAGIIKGFEWAEAKQLEILVRFTDTWVPLIPWQEGLLRVARESQFATLSAGWMAASRRFTSDAIAFHTPSWRRFFGIQLLREHAELETPVAPDSVVYQSASGVFDHNCKANRKFCEEELAPSGFGCCGYWPIALGGNIDPRSGALSRNWGSAHDYLRALQQWRIEEYSLEEIEAALQTNVENPLEAAL